MQQRTITIEPEIDTPKRFVVASGGVVLGFISEIDAGPDMPTTFDVWIGESHQARQFLAHVGTEAEAIAGCVGAGLVHAFRQ